MRSEIKNCQRICIKIGTSVITGEDDKFALGRMATLIEQMVEYHRSGKEIIIVSSGSVGLGKFILGNGDNVRACASCGQSKLMANYNFLFSQYNIAVAQVLVTESDFNVDIARENLIQTINHLCENRVIPIINENDVVSVRATPIRDENGKVFWDNDSLAALISIHSKVDCLILLSDIDGIYTDLKNKKILSFYQSDAVIEIGQNSRMGRGGILSKIESAKLASKNGVSFVIVANGYNSNVLKRILNGQNCGTLFSTKKFDQPKQLQRYYLSHKHRTDILRQMITIFEEKKQAIIASNLLDLKAFSGQKDSAFYQRLKCDDKTIDTIIQSLKVLIELKDPLKTIRTIRQLTQNLNLIEIFDPLGKICVIFESRPDVYPILLAMAIKTNNSCFFKAGHETVHTNTYLQSCFSKLLIDYQIIEAFILTFDRADLDLYLAIEQFDLIIPRGSASLIQSIKEKTSQPVIGHADGICHIYVDDELPDKAIDILLDAKIDSPASCNSLETILYSNKLPSTFINQLIYQLQQANVLIFGCEETCQEYNQCKLTTRFDHEYSALAITLKKVQTIDQAIDHINKYGSHHTDAILTTNITKAKKFIRQIDSANVFLNCTTRLSDGYRYGFGAEVGISTSKISTRGPIGCFGLCINKFIIVSEIGHTLKMFKNQELSFQHHDLTPQELSSLHPTLFTDDSI